MSPLHVAQRLLGQLQVLFGSACCVAASIGLPLVLARSGVAVGPRPWQLLGCARRGCLVAPPAARDVLAAGSRPQTAQVFVL